MNAIIEKIENTPRHMKSKVVKECKDEMLKLDEDVTVCLAEILEQRRKVNEAI